MPDSLLYFLNFSCDQSPYRPGGPLHGSQQTDAIQLGPFDDHIDITGKWLRIGHYGEPVAVFEDGLWKVGLEPSADLTAEPARRARADALLFTDVAVTAEIASPATNRNPCP